MTQVDWERVTSQLANDGFAILRGLPGAARARAWAEQLCPEDRTVRYLDDDDLPAPLATWRNRLYGRLVSIANAWNEALGEPYRFPPEWSELLACNRAAGQRRTQSFIHRLREADYQALHQCREGEHVFPLQLVVLLSDPATDFSGGELVVTERRPRMQSRPLVVPLGFGDAALIPTAKRPVMGGHGFYSTDSKHGVSRVRSGERVGLELSFHDAPAEVQSRTRRSYACRV